METLSRVGAHLDVVGACCGCEEEEGEEGGEEGGVEVWGVHCYLGVVVVAVVEDLESDGGGFGEDLGGDGEDLCYG